MKFRCALGIALGLASVVPASGQASQDLLKKARCNACHAVDSKRVGPALRDVAERYKGQPDTAQVLFAKVRQGGSGNWGTVPMMPNDESKIGDDDLKALIAWILAGAQ